MFIDSFSEPTSKLTLTRSIPVTIEQEPNGRYHGYIPGLDRTYVEVWGDSVSGVTL